MKIAILGCGYVGSAVGAALVRLGHDVVGTTTTPERVDELKQRGIKPEVLTLAETRRLAELLRERQFVFLTIAAGCRHGDYRAVYLDGVRQVLACLPGTAVEHVVYTSSSAVYGQDDGGWVDEDSPTEPSSERGRILVAAERELLAGAGELGRTATVLRLSGIYGPGRDPVDWVRRDAGRERAEGNVYLNLVPRDLVVEACVRLLSVPYHGVLNLSGDDPLPRRVFYDRLLKGAGLPPIRWTDAPDTAPGGKRLDNRRIKKLLGLKLDTKRA